MIFSKIEMMLSKVLPQNNATYLKLFCKKAKKYFSKLEPKFITDNRKFGNQLNHSVKITAKEIINVPENGEILNSDTDIVDAFTLVMLLKISIFQGKTLC